MYSEWRSDAESGVCRVLVRVPLPVLVSIWILGVLLPAFPVAAESDPRPIVTVDVVLAELSYRLHFTEDERASVEADVRRSLIAHLEEEVGFLRFVEPEDPAADEDKASLELRIGKQDGTLPRPIHLHAEIDGPLVRRWSREKGGREDAKPWAIPFFDIDQSVLALPSPDEFLLLVVERIRETQRSRWVDGVFRFVTVAEKVSGHGGGSKWFWRLPFTLAQIRAQEELTRFRVQASYVEPQSSNTLSVTHDAEAACETEPSATNGVTPCWASSGKARAAVTDESSVESLLNAERAQAQWIAIATYWPPPSDSGSGAPGPVLGGGS